MALIKVIDDSTCETFEGGECAPYILPFFFFFNQK